MVPDGTAAVVEVVAGPVAVRNTEHYLELHPRIGDSLLEYPDGVPVADLVRVRGSGRSGLQLPIRTATNCIPNRAWYI